MGALKDTGIRLSEVERVPYESAFLIGDLLTNRITLLSGEPKAGKTLLAVAMVTALMDGSTEFLGLPIHRQLKRVVFGLTDDGASEELRERFIDAVDETCITVFSVADTSNPEYWTELAEDLKAHGADLFVLDNILGSLAVGDDIAASTTATTVIRNLRPISEAGIPVLAVTHTPKGTGEGVTVASSPIGGRAIGGGARGIVALRNSKKGGRIIETAMNRAQRNLDLKVDVRRRSEDSDVPVWTVRECSTRARRTPVVDKAQAMVDRIVAEQPSATSLRAVAAAYASDFGWSPETARRRLGGRVAHDPLSGWTAA